MKVHAPLPEEKPEGLSRSTWWRARKRGYLIQYPAPESTAGPEPVRNVQALASACVQAVLRRKSLHWMSPDEVWGFDRSLSYDDLVQEGIAAGLEEVGDSDRFVKLCVRSIGRAVDRPLYRIKRRPEYQMIPIEEMEERLEQPGDFFRECLIVVGRKSVQAAIDLQTWRDEGGVDDPPRSALNILIKEMR